MYTQKIAAAAGFSSGGMAQRLFVFLLLVSNMETMIMVLWVCACVMFLLLLLVYVCVRVWLLVLGSAAYKAISSAGTASSFC
jgi:hypothetical protein